MSFHSSDQPNPFIEEDEDVGVVAEHSHPEQPRPSDPLLGVKRLREEDGEMALSHASPPPHQPAPLQPLTSGYAFEDDEAEGDGLQEDEEDRSSQRQGEAPLRNETTAAASEAGHEDGVETPEDEEAVEEGGGGEEEDETAGGEENDEEGEEEPEEDGESIRAVSLRLSELEAKARLSSGRYSFELRMAEAEAESLRQFIQAQQDIIDAAEKAKAAAMRTDAAEGADVSPSALTAASVRRQLAADPRIALTVRRLVRATAQLRRLEGRVGKLRELLDEAPATHKGESSSGTPGAAHSLRAQLLGAGARPCDGESGGLMSFDEFQQTTPSTAEQLPEGVRRDISDSGVFTKSLLQALPYISSPEKRDLVKRLLVSLGHLSQYDYHLARYQAYLREQKLVAEEQEEEALLTAEEWALMTAQIACSRDLAQLSSSQVLTEARAVARNAALHQRLTSLQAALASLVVSRVHAGSTPMKGTVPHRLRAALEAESAQLQVLREALVKEVLFLRKQTRSGGGYGNVHLTGSRFDLLMDAESDMVEQKNARVDTVSSILTRQLVLDSHAQVKRVVDSLMSLVNGESSPANDAVVGLRMRMVELREQMASRHRSMSALVAANARLAQEIQSVSHVGSIASESEKASQVASILLMKLGFSSPSEHNNDGEDEETEDGGDDTTQDTSLSTIESHVLALFHERTRSLVEVANRHVDAVYDALVRPEQASRARTAMLLRLLTLKDFSELSAATVAPPPETTPLADAVSQLERAFPAAPDDESASLAMATVPANNRSVQEAFRRMMEAKFAAAEPAWAALQKASLKAREELDWHSQYAVEEVPARLATARDEKKALLQRTLDAGKRSKQAGDDKQLAATLSTELRELEEGKVPQAQAHVAVLKNQLRRLQEEFDEKRAETEVAEKAAEAERQRQLQLQEEEEQRAAEARTMQPEAEEAPQATAVEGDRWEDTNEKAEEEGEEEEDEAEARESAPDAHVDGEEAAEEEALGRDTGNEGSLDEGNDDGAQLEAPLSPAEIDDAIPGDVAHVKADEGEPVVASGGDVPIDESSAVPGDRTALLAEEEDVMATAPQHADEAINDGEGAPLPTAGDGDASAPPPAEGILGDATPAREAAPVTDAVLPSPETPPVLSVSPRAPVLAAKGDPFYSGFGFDEWDE